MYNYEANLRCKLIGLHEVFLIHIHWLWINTPDVFLYSCCYNLYLNIDFYVLYASLHMHAKCHHLCKLHISIFNNHYFKVIENVTVRQSAYDFLLTLHGNHGPLISFRNRRRFPSKIAKKFPTSLYFAPQLYECVPLGIGYRRRDQKTRMMALTSWERSMTISSANWIQYTNVSDERTDRHRPTPGDSTDRAYA